MKRTLNFVVAAVVLATIFISGSVKAQSIIPAKLRFGIGVDGGLVTGDAHDFSKIMLGGTGRLQYGLTNNFAVTLTSGYYNFFGRSYDAAGDKAQSLGMVPIKAGVKAFFSKNIYVAGEAGIGIETKTFLPQGVDESYGVKNNKLILSPGLGYASKSWDVGVRYENYSGQSVNYGVVALRVAYGFGVK